MHLDYKLSDENYHPTQEVESKIQMDLLWIHNGNIQEDIGEQQPIYLVNGNQFEDFNYDGARALGYVPKTKRIHNTDGVILGYRSLSQPLEELSETQLSAISKEGANTLLRMGMLMKLKDLAIDINNS